MNFERASFVKNVEEPSGIALEKELFGGLDLPQYKGLVIDALIDQKLQKRGERLTAVDIKRRDRGSYEELKQEAGLEYLKDIHNPILTDEAMFNIVKRSQLNRPPRPFVFDMKKSFAERVGVDESAVKFYSSLGTNADYCGVDGIFSIDIQGYNFDITVDLTKKSVFEKKKDIQKKIAEGGKYLGDIIFSLDGRGDDYSRERDADLLPEFTELLFERLRYLVDRHNERIEQIARKNNR